jgi:hypothetical protein
VSALRTRACLPYPRNLAARARRPLIQSACRARAQSTERARSGQRRGCNMPRPCCKTRRMDSARPTSAAPPAREERKEPLVRQAVRGVAGAAEERPHGRGDLGTAEPPPPPGPSETRRSDLCTARTRVSLAVRVSHTHTSGVRGGTESRESRTASAAQKRQPTQRRYPTRHGLRYPTRHGLRYPTRHGLRYPTRHGLRYPTRHGLRYPTRHGLRYPTRHGLPHRSAQRGAATRNGQGERAHASVRPIRA